MQRIHRSLAATALIASLLAAAPASAQQAAFTYQGELKENGSPAAGAFDLDFSLWDAFDGGSQIGATIALDDVPVADGKFAVELDFGATAFDNSGRWLEITVEGFTLSPRTPITRSPYSIQTRGIYVDENENVGLGTTDAGLGQLTIRETGAGAAIAIDAESSHNVFPTLFALNPSGPSLWAQGNSDASLASGGIIVAGHPGGQNLAIDDNEIMSRNGGQPSSLYLNAEGGAVNMGAHNIHPAYAYGHVRSDGTLFSGSSNIASVNWQTAGICTVSIHGSTTQSDISSSRPSSTPPRSGPRTSMSTGTPSTAAADAARTRRSTSTA